jgi:hypothetical protein
LNQFRSEFLFGKAAGRVNRSLAHASAYTTVNEDRLTLGVRLGLVVLGICLLGSTPAHARGPSPYLPLNMSPSIERQIERVLILAGKPVMRRPIAAAVVLDALPIACEREPALCESVRGYLQRYMGKYAITHARPEISAVSGESESLTPNQHGQRVDSTWEVSASAFFQPNDHLILNAGAVAYEGEVTPTGSFLSLGFDFAQLDIGFRDHWLGPMSDSSALISTEAPTMPSVTLSNYVPISPLGLSYEIFAAEMSDQRIAFEGATTTGKPRLAGLQLGMEPVIGYAVSLNRITQYGGGPRGGEGVSDFWDALWTSSNEQGSSDVNRIASLASNMLFPGPVPFGVRVEYAGEDNTYGGKHRLGQTMLSLGLDFPTLWRNFDASYEVTEFQNGWYVHHVYPDGPRNEGAVLGHWFGDNRLPGDAIGGRSHHLQIGWQLSRGDYAQASYRALDLDPRWTFEDADRPYQTMQVLEFNYATHWKGHPIEAHLQVGEDVFGESFARVGAAFDFAPGRVPSAYAETEDSTSSSTELFVDAGVQYSRAREFLHLQFLQRDTTAYEANYHLGVGARRAVSARSDLGTRLEFDEVADRTLISIRALDYRFRVNRRLALGAFLGVGRYDLTLDAHGYYFGAGVQYRDVLPGFDLGLDYRRYDKLNRDKGLPSDPESNPGLPRRYIDVDGVSLYMSKRW